jgi:hypothetical protein
LIIIISAEACLGIADPDLIQQLTAGIQACGFFLVYAIDWIVTLKRRIRP